MPLPLPRICLKLASNSASDAIFKLVLENRAPRAGGDSCAAQAGRRPAHAGCAGRQARLQLLACSLRQVAPASASPLPHTCLKLNLWCDFQICAVKESASRRWRLPNAEKQGKSPPGDGVQARIAAAKGTSACGIADEGTAASDAARGLDAQRPGRTAPALGGPRGCSRHWRAATSRQSGPRVPRCAPISASTQAVLLWTQFMIDCPRWPCAAVVSGQLRLAGAAERYESVTSLRARYVRTLRQRFIRNGVDVPEDVTKRCAPSSPSQHAYALVFLSGFG